MHAIVCRQHGGAEVMQYEEVPRPEPSEHDVLIQAAAIGVNFVDTMRRSGAHPTAPDPPFTPGIEVCGRVAAVGSQVTRFQTDDRVIGRTVALGAYAEFVSVEERFTVACPDELTAQQGAALFVNGQTAYHALFTVGAAQPSDNVLITASAGGVGTCAVQAAKLLGAKVIAAAGTSEKLDLAKTLGADVLVDYTEPGWPQRVLDATDGNGVDLIVESVGGDVALSCVKCWAIGGRMVIFGKASGTPALVSGDDLLFGNRVVYGLAVGRVIEDESLMRRAMDQLTLWVLDGSLRLQIGQAYPLREAAQAHRELEGRATHGKLLLVP